MSLPLVFNPPVQSATTNQLAPLRFPFFICHLEIVCDFLCYQSPAVLEFDLEVIYIDVGKKIDCLLATSHTLKDSDTIQEEAKDYLKILHSIINVC